MSEIKIYPSRLKGEVTIPPSKSIAHRAIICASLSRGISIIENIDLSDDIRATIGAMRSLGAKIEVINENEAYKSFRIDGRDTFKINSSELIKINCNESGSTLRFLIPLALHYDGEISFIGEGNLKYRPQDIYIDIFQKEGIEFNIEGDEDEYLPFNLKGKRIYGNFYINGDVSSQFISGLLLSLPLMKEDSKIIMKNSIQSKGYVDLTIEVLKEFGITIENQNYEVFNIKGNQEYKPKNYIVEGDYSQAAFFLVANALGADIDINGLKKESRQGDKVILEIIKFIEDYNQEKHSDLFFIDKNNTLIINAKDIPDIVPILTVLCSFININTKIVNAGRLRIKESDRLMAISKNLNDIGCNIQELENSLFIRPVDELIGGIVSGFNDHRIVMSLSIAAMKCKEPLIIKEYQAIQKSYTNFFKDFEKINGVLEYKLTR